MLVTGFFFRNFKGTERGKIQDICFCAAIALIVSTVFNLSPFNNYLPNQDSGVFIYIGEQMKEGYIPYRDFFDHKGILLFFIQYLGLLLPFKNYIGIWILEVINMTITSWLLFKIAGLFTEKKVIKYVSLVGVLLVCGFQFYSGGNYTEEWALPWVCMAMYVFLKYLQEDKYRFSDIVWLGIGFAVIAFLRVNMVTLWIAIMPVIVIRMLSLHRFKDLWQCAKGFVLGLFIVILPILLYTFATGCFEAMISYYIRFNFSYSQDAGNWGNVIQSIYQFVKLVPFAMVCGGIAIISNKKNRLFLMNLFAFMVSLPFTYMSGRFDLNYGIILLPYLLPLMICGIEVIYDVIQKICKFSLPNKFMENKIYLLGFLFVVIAAFYIQSDDLYLSKETEEIRDYLIENTEQDDDVLIVGSQGMKFYILTDRKTNNKFFYQTPPVKISDELCKEFLSELENKPSDTVLVLNSREFWNEREDNLGRIYKYLEDLVQNDLYSMEDYGHFFVYKKVLQ